MAARAIWKGAIGFGDVEVPVKLYSAVQDAGVHFRLLHDRDHAPVVQRMVNPRHGKEVRRESTRMAAPVARGRFVVLTPEELASIEPEPSRVIEIVRFVPEAALDHAYYDRPYWLAPDGRRDGGYWALVQALSDEHREGIARWVMRKRAYTGALRVRDDRLVLITTRHGGEVVEPAEVATPAGRAPTAQELAMARQLVGMLEGGFEPEQYRDEYRDRVLELVRRKARGEKIPVTRPPHKRPVSNLVQALRKSLAASTPAAKGRERGRRAHG